jgi:hypothetical protein
MSATRKGTTLVGPTASSSVLANAVTFLPLTRSCEVNTIKMFKVAKVLFAIGRERHVKVVAGFLILLTMPVLAIGRSTLDRIRHR